MTETVITSIFSNCVHSKFKVDSTLNSVECGICGKELNPMWVLSQLCYNESRARRNLNHLKALSTKAEAKNRCKCEHCGKMTKVQKR